MCNGGNGEMQVIRSGEVYSVTTLASQSNDTAQVLTHFSATLRNEVDLDQLCEQLLAVVQETMQPAHFSLWIGKPERTNTPSIQISTPPLKLLEEMRRSQGMTHERLHCLMGCTTFPGTT